MRRAVAIPVASLLLLVGYAQGSRKTAIAPSGPAPAGAPAPGPYSQGVSAGDFVYISGQSARDRSGQLAAAADDQVRQALKNVREIVEAAGLTMGHVVYSQVYLTDMSQYEALERGWREAFPKAPPARAVVGMYKLAGDTPITIDAVAFRDLSRRRLIVPDGYPPTQPWTPGVMAGERLYLSGSFGADAVTGEIPGDPAAQVQLALDNMRRILQAAGMDFAHVVFVNPYQTARASDQMNAIYAKHFEFGNTPARATIRVTSLPADNTIEFTGVAVADLSNRRAVRPKNMRPSPTASPCVFAGDTYYCSAKGPFTPGPNAVQGIYAPTVESQVRQTMRNLLDGLEEAGLELAQVVDTHVYLDDVNDQPKVDRIYGLYFPSVLPARTLVAQIAPGPRASSNGDTYPQLEQMSLIAVR